MGERRYRRGHDDAGGPESRLRVELRRHAQRAGATFRGGQRWHSLLPRDDAEHRAGAVPYGRNAAGHAIGLRFHPRFGRLKSRSVSGVGTQLYVAADDPLYGREWHLLNPNADPPGLSASPGAVYSITGPVSQKVLSISTGTVTLAADVGATYGGISISVSSGGQLIVQSVQHIAALTLQGGTLDLTKQKLYCTASLATIRTYLQNHQIVTSSPGGSVGYLDNGSGQTEIAFALAGDANIDGSVNVGDLVAWPRHTG